MYERPRLTKKEPPTYTIRRDLADALLEDIQAGGATATIIDMELAQEGEGIVDIEITDGAIEADAVIRRWQRTD